MKYLVLIVFQGLVLRVAAQTPIISTEIGTASFYAKKFEGRKCSSGEIFRNDSLTAAHKTFGFGTLVKVTNLQNDSAVIVRINDRLPGSSKRKIDLSRAAARQLGFINKGLAKVRIEVLSRPES